MPTVQFIILCACIMWLGYFVIKAAVLAALREHDRTVKKEPPPDIQFEILEALREHDEERNLG